MLVMHKDRGFVPGVPENRRSSNILLRAILRWSWAIHDCRRPPESRPPRQFLPRLWHARSCPKRRTADVAHHALQCHRPGDFLERLLYLQSFNPGRRPASWAGERPPQRELRRGAARVRGNTGPVARVAHAVILHHEAPRSELRSRLRGRAAGGAAARTASSPARDDRLWRDPADRLLGTLLGLLVASQQIAAHSGYATATDIASGVYESLLHFDRIAGSGDSCVRCLQLSLGARKYNHPRDGTGRHRILGRSSMRCEGRNGRKRETSAFTCSTSRLGCFAPALGLALILIFSSLGDFVHAAARGSHRCPALAVFSRRSGIRDH